MARKRTRILTVSEFVVILAVIGIFASIAAPSYIRIQRSSRIEHLLASARVCGRELPRWLSNSLSVEPDTPSADRIDSANGETQEFDPQGVFEDYARIYNGRCQQGNLPGQEPLLIVERAGIPPGLCRRDGKIHIIPLVDSSIKGLGARVVVTDENRTGGPNHDGILAVFDVQPGAE